jgi:hypothetical protein
MTYRINLRDIRSGDTREHIFYVNDTADLLRQLGTELTVYPHWLIVSVVYQP